MRGRALPLGLMFITMAVAGCLNGDDDAGDDGVTPPPDGPGQAFFLHRAGTTITVADLAGPLTELADLSADWRPVVDPEFGHMDAREPTVGVDSQGWIYYAARDYSGGAGTPLSGTQTPVMRSQDGGLTWLDVSPRMPTGDREPPRSGDPMIWVDPWTDRIFQIELYDLVCNWLVYSDDGGESWMGNVKACGTFVVDHQTIAAGPPAVAPAMPVYENVVYVCVNQLADSNCATSYDGGVTFGPSHVVFHALDPNCIAGGGLHGHVLVDPVGTAYLPRQYCDRPFVGVSRDEGLTWELVDVSSGVGASDQDPNMAFDAAGNVYYLWIGDDEQLYLVVSSDQGSTWTDPVRVNPPEVTAVNHPSITAGSDGRIGFEFTGTTNEDPPLDDDESDAWDDVVWYSYMGVSIDALAAEPTFAVVQVSDDPVYRGNCIHQRCGFMREFMDATAAPDGSFYTALVDACIREDEPREKEGGDCNAVADDYGEGNGHLGYVGVTTGGPSLWEGGSGWVASSAALQPLLSWAPGASVPT